VGAADFAAAARQRGLTVREIGPVAKAEPVEGLGRIQEAQDALFALPASGVSEAIKVPEGYAILRLVAVEPAQRPDEVKLVEVREAVLRAVRREKAQAAAEARARTLAETWRKGEDPRALARREAVAFGEIGPFSRAEPLADRALGQALAPVALGLPPGAVADPVTGPGGLFVVQTVVREPPDPGGFEAARAQVETRLLQDKRSQLVQAWLAGLRGAAKVEVNRKILPAS
jgi:parvulin-like peptidyl-prolyl isomerase